MEFGKAIKKSIDIIKLDEKTIGEISKDKDAWKIGLLIIAIGGVLGALASYVMINMMSSMFDMMGLGIFGNLAKTASITSVISAPIGAIIGAFIGVGILFIIIKIFGGKAKYMELFAPISFLSILSWLGILNIIPILGGLINLVVGVWSIIVTIVIVKKINAFTTGKAVLVVLIPLIVIMLIVAVLIAIAVAIFGTGAISAMNELGTI